MCSGPPWKDAGIPGLYPEPGDRWRLCALREYAVDLYKMFHRRICAGGHLHI